MNDEGRGRTALVTGASAGIGEAFARLLAARGYDLVLTARRQERLEALAASLRSAHGVTARVVVADLARPEGAAAVVDGLTQVDVLVNNAGLGIAPPYAETSWAQQRDFIQLLVTAPAELTHRLLEGMVRRRWGRIINVASLAALVPSVAGNTLYAAAKSFLVKMSESLRLEVEGTGVHVSALCPGFTYSEFHDVSGTRAIVSTLPGFMWSSAEQVAEEGYRGVMRNEAVVVPGNVSRALALLSRLLPGSLAEAAARRAGRRLRGRP